MFLLILCIPFLLIIIQLYCFLEIYTIVSFVNKNISIKIFDYLDLIAQNPAEYMCPNFFLNIEIFPMLYSL